MHEVEKAAVVEEAGLSRKKFLAGAAGIVVGSAFMGVVPKAANAQGAPTDDQDILNYALTLEHLEYQFYIQVLQRFDGRAFRNQNGFPATFGRYIVVRARANFGRIRSHEQAHVDFLEDALGANAVPELEYDFGITDLPSAIEIAQILENTGVQAYTGAIGHIEDAETQAIAATVATVEARHASYLNFINVDSPFPDALDEARPPREICEEVKAFITTDTSQGPYGPYESYDAFCEDLPDTTFPPA